jgi:pyrimidine deaminase RibD-like protein
MRRDLDRHWLAEAIKLAANCPPAETAFSVGAILVDAAGEIIATGFSREGDPKDHAEEVALGKVDAGTGLAGADLSGATLYSSLEPCLNRLSRPVSCAELIYRHGVGRVVLAWREPPIFQPGGGAAWLASRGVVVTEFPELARAAQAVNRPLLDRYLD